MCVKRSIHHKSINPDCSAIEEECPILSQSTGLGIRFSYFSYDRPNLLTICKKRGDPTAILNQPSNLTAHRQVLGLESRAGSYPCSRVLCNPTGRPQRERATFGILQSWRNRGSRFLQSTGLWLNFGKPTILLQLRSIEFDGIEIASQPVTVQGCPTKLQTQPNKLGQIANRNLIDHRRIV